MPNINVTGFIKSVTGNNNNKLITCFKFFNALNILISRLINLRK